MDSVWYGDYTRRLIFLIPGEEQEKLYGMEWMKENEPYKWELLTMLQEMEQ